MRRSLIFAWTRLTSETLPGRFGDTASKACLRERRSVSGSSICGRNLTPSSDDRPRITHAETNRHEETLSGGEGHGKERHSPQADIERTRLLGHPLDGI